MPPSSEEGYYFPYVRDGYCSGTYDATFSDGVVTLEEVDTFLTDVNSLPNANPNPIQVLFFVGIAVIFLGFILGAIFAKISYFMAMSITLGVLGGFTLIYFGCKRDQKYKAQRMKDVNVLIEKHKNSTFKGKNIEVRSSPLGAYLVIEFLWKEDEEDGQGPYLQGATPQPGFIHPPPLPPTQPMTMVPPSIPGYTYPASSQMPPYSLAPAANPHAQLPPGFAQAGAPFSIGAPGNITASMPPSLPPAANGPPSFAPMGQAPGFNPGYAQKSVPRQTIPLAKSPPVDKIDMK